MLVSPLGMCFGLRLGTFMVASIPESMAAGGHIHAHVSIFMELDRSKNSKNASWDFHENISKSTQKCFSL